MLPFDRAVARIGDFFFRRNRVDVRRIPAQRNLDAQVRGAFHQPFEQIAGPVGPCLVDDFVEGLNPLGGFLRIEVVGSFDFGFQHGGILKVASLSSRPASAIRGAPAGGRGPSLGTASTLS